MKNTNLLHAMDNIDPRLILDAAPDIPRKKRVNKRWVKWASLAACLCLIAIAAFTITLKLNDRGDIVDNVLPTDIDHIIWSSELGPDIDSKEEFSEWNGFFVDPSLYDALQKDSDEYIAVMMTRADGRKIEETESDELLAKTLNRDYHNGNLYLFVTRDQFLHWNLDNKGDYLFCLASRSAYEGAVTEGPAEEKDPVTGSLA